MKKVLFLISILFFYGGNVYSQTNKTFFLGHSLVNFHTPNMVNKLSIAASKNFSYDANIGIGSNLQNHWNNPTSGQGSFWNTTLPTGGFENFIITEAVPLLPHLQWSNTYRFADSLYRFAMQANPDIQYYIYETWHCTNSGNGSTSGEGGYPCDWDAGSTVAWRDRLTTDLVHWESIADSINLIHNKDMLIIPAGQAMGRLYDSIVANKVPGITSMNQLFGDNIHLTYTGVYFIACVMYGVIHKESPVGLPNQLTDEWDILYSDYPTPAQAEMMQRIAWSTLCDYPRDGVDCSPSSLSIELLEAESNYSMFPNPTKDKVTLISNKMINTLEIINVFGQRVCLNQNINSTSFELSLSSFDKGIYFANVTTNEGISSQKLILE